MFLRSRALSALLAGVLLAVSPAHAGPFDPPVESAWESPIEAMDVNNDGTQDIISIQKTGKEPPGFPSRGRVLARDGRSGLLLWRTPLWTIARWRLIDTDGQGLTEMAVLEGGPTASALTINLGGVLGTPGGGLHLLDLATGTPRWDYGPTPGNLSTEIGDADGDGRDDLVVTHFNQTGPLLSAFSYTIKTLRGLSGEVVAEASFSTTQNRPPDVRAVRDVSGDEIADLIVLGNLAGSSQSTLTSATLDGAVHWSFEVPDASGLEANPVLENPSGRDILLFEGGTGLVARDGGTGTRLWSRSDAGRIPEVIGDADGDGTSDVALEGGISEEGQYRGNWIRVLSGHTGSDLYYKEFRFDVPDGYHLGIFIANEGPVVPTGDLDGDGVSDFMFFWCVRNESDYLGCSSFKTIAISQKEGILLWEHDSPDYYPFKLTPEKEGQDVDDNGRQDLVWRQRTDDGGMRFIFHFVDGATFAPIWTAISDSLPSSLYTRATTVVSAELASEHSGPEVALGIAYEVRDGDDYRYRTRIEGHSQVSRLWATDSP